jgi:hypothetical protein
VDVRAGHVEIDGRACLDAGWLEQVACSPGTREHEALVVVPARPSDIHAALLMAGFQSGRPGRWVYENEQVQIEPPTGEVLEVLARYQRADGQTITESITEWIRDEAGDRRLPGDAWVFGGSELRADPSGSGEHYVADRTGSIIGLVTFGDEVIGLRDVLPDQAAVYEPEWMVDTQRVPAPGTAVTLIVRRP